MPRHQMRFDSGPLHWHAAGTQADGVRARSKKLYASFSNCAAHAPRGWEPANVAPGLNQYSGRATPCLELSLSLRIVIRVAARMPRLNRQFKEMAMKLRSTQGGSRARSG